MSRNLISRRAGVLVAASFAGVLTMAGPALADVTVNPPSAPQGSGVNLHFAVKNTGQSAITRVKLVMPADTPVAEVFPLSVDDWAPQITEMKLATPLTSIHGGTPVTSTAAAITWIAVQGKAIPPGGTADLAVALGPMPSTSSMVFQVQPTYADGKPGPVVPPVQLALTPAVPGQEPVGHAGHEDAGGAAAGPVDSSSSDDAAFAAFVAQAEQGPSFWAIAGWIVAGLALAGAAYAVLRNRHRRADDEDEPDERRPDDEDSKEPVAAGAKVTNWSYRD